MISCTTLVFFHASIHILCRCVSQSRENSYMPLIISVPVDFLPMKPSSSSRSACAKGETFPAVFLFTVFSPQTFLVSSFPLYNIWTSSSGGNSETRPTGLLTGLPKPFPSRPCCRLSYFFLNMARRALSMLLLTFFRALPSLSQR